MARRIMKLSVMGAIATILTFGGGCLADPGVTAESIVFGQSAPLEGQASALGRDMRAGLRAAFEEANLSGGVSGRRLELVSHDDDYEPGRAAVAAQKLIWDDGVFALVGAIGIPSATAIRPLAEAAGVPFVSPFGGVAFGLDDTLRAVVSLRATLDREIDAWIDRLTTDLGVRRIAVFYQNDEFGKSGLSLIEKAMEARGLPIVARGSYTRNTTAVKAALLGIRKAKPDAVLMLGVYAPCAEFVRLAHRLEFAPVFVTSGSVGTHALAQDLGAEGAGVFVTQVVPSPEDTSLPLVAAYREALPKTSPEVAYDFVSLEGYAIGRMVVAALRRQPGEPTREGVLRVLRDGDRIDVGGMTLQAGGGATTDPVQILFTRIQADGSVKVVDRLTRSEG